MATVPKRHSTSESTRQELKRYLVESMGEGPLTLDRDQVRVLFFHLCQRMSIGHVWSEAFGEYLTSNAFLAVTGDANKKSLGPAEVDALLDYMKYRPLMAAEHPKKCVVLGGGAYGTAIAQVLAKKGHPVTIVMLDSEKKDVEAIMTTHRNPSCFPNKVLHPFLIKAISEDGMTKPLAEADFILLAVPVQFTFDYLSKHRDIIPSQTPIVCVSKGIDAKTTRFMSEIIPTALQRDQPSAFLAGPSFAKEMMDDAPTCVTVASVSRDLARAVQVLFSSNTFRVLTTDDVMGVEVGSALKNVLAIATGMCKGLGYGPNTQMALVTRGWADIRHVARSLGGREETMTGLAGIGDVMLTCFGGMSRNAKFGERLAKTGSVKQALDEAGGTVEGYPTAGAIKQLALTKKLDLPVLGAISDMLSGALPPQAAVMYIMTLPLGPEERPQNSRL